jgi:putative peptide zinc metalloprotease protein
MTTKYRSVGQADIVGSEASSLEHDVFGSPSECCPVRCLRPGVELVGRYKDSGYVDDKYLVRRQDGSMLEMTSVVYGLLQLVDGKRTDSELGREFGLFEGEPVTGPEVADLLDRVAAPHGLFDDEHEDKPLSTSAAAGSIFVIKAKRVLFRETTVRTIASLLSWLFHPVIVVGVVVGSIAMCVHLADGNRLRAAGRMLLDRPSLALLVMLLDLLMLLFHEFGHAAACSRGGASPANIGCGLYVFWPALYTDVSDSYRLDRRGRVRTDLGGVYFNAVGGLFLTTIGLRANQPALLGAGVLSFLQIPPQLLPFYRFDGYWLIADLSGVSDPFLVRRAAVWSVIPERWRRVPPPNLRTGPRRIIAAWACATTVFLPVQIAFGIFTAPTFLSESLVATDNHLRSFQAAIDDSSVVQVLLAVLSILTTLSFVVAICFGFGLLSYRGVQLVSRRIRPRLLRPLGAIVVAGLIWVPIVALFPEAYRRADNARNVATNSVAERTAGNESTRK